MVGILNPLLFKFVLSFHPKETRHSQRTFYYSIWERQIFVQIVTSLNNYIFKKWMCSLPKTIPLLYNPILYNLKYEIVLMCFSSALVLWIEKTFNHQIILKQKNYINQENLLNLYFFLLKLNLSGYDIWCKSTYINIKLIPKMKSRNQFYQNKEKMIFNARFSFYANVTLSGHFLLVVRNFIFIKKVDYVFLTFFTFEAFFFTGHNCTIFTAQKKWSFPLRISSANVTKSAVSYPNPVTFTEEILNKKLYFLCSDFRAFFCLFFFNNPEAWKSFFNLLCNKIKLFVSSIFYSLPFDSR